MSTKSSPKPRSKKRQTKDDIITETVAPVHKPIKNENYQSESIQLSNEIENKAEIDTSSESNKTFTIEDRNDNLNIQNSFIGRDISIESELQINSKIERGIIGFMETEIKKEKSKYSHFTDSRPQSLSFYEEEKAPEELSGQLEQLSPEEKRVLKRQKHDRKIDIELDASTYKEIQNVLNREKEDQLLAGIIKSQKSKSRKKKQFDSEESLAGIGDSREQMIPSTKRKTKKSKSKSKESSPLPGSSSHKKKHRKRDMSPRNEICVALEELQDDVFEKDPKVHYPKPTTSTYQQDERPKMPNKSNVIYVQRRGGFDCVPREAVYDSIEMGRDDDENKGCLLMIPIALAVLVQKKWLPFTVLCHGFLAGLALAHSVIISNNVMSAEFVRQYQTYSELYSSTFYFLCVICVVSVFDRFDLTQCNFEHVRDILEYRKCFIVIFIYVAALIIHVANVTYDEKIQFYKFTNTSDNSNNMTLIVTTAPTMNIAMNPALPPNILTPKSSDSKSLTNLAVTTASSSSFSMSPSPPTITPTVPPSKNAPGSESSSNMDVEDLKTWSYLSISRSILAVIGWFIIALTSSEDSLYKYLADLAQYAPQIN